ncbi:hypothetical protein QFZ79_002945 [Arthrobacter sp. V4I6]|uniref:hypothetical protein n=1 Tax=Arthrobacter sp. V4I6 TaxID=3042281 RepID=UPI00278198E7|nr:hypothetical protein [Arthrobacter sp. V4I6]MDQ0854834.1 hypothetical protein [Arthrobacter sp. V4I6]
MRAAVFEDLDWMSDAHEVLVKVAAEGKPFDAYALTEKAELRDPPSSAMWGKLFQQANEAGVIKAVGFHRSRRPGRSGGACRVWQVAA